MLSFYNIIVNFAQIFILNIRAEMDKRLSIDSWELPSCVSAKYKTAGIKQIFPWQRDCLMTGNALKGGK